MAQKPLTEGGGEAAFVAARFPHDQAGRLQELADAAGMTKSEFVRQAVADAIERIEREKLVPT